MHKYAHIGIYIDAYDNLFGIPCGNSPKYGIVYLNIIVSLKSPYSAAELENFILTVFKKCYSEQHKDDDSTALETHFNVKGYTNASSGLRFVFVSRTQDKGYRFVPSNREKCHYTHIEKKAVSIKLKYSNGDIAEAFNKVLIHSKLGCFSDYT